MFRGFPSVITVIASSLMIQENTGKSEYHYPRELLMEITPHSYSLKMTIGEAHEEYLSMKLEIKLYKSKFTKETDEATGAKLRLIFFSMTDFSELTKLI